MLRSNKAAAERQVYIHSVEPVEWCKHTAERCKVCENIVMRQKGGRPTKQRKGKGRPTSTDTHTLLTEAQKIAPTSFFPEMQEKPSHLVPTTVGINPADVECHICGELLDRAVHLLHIQRPMWPV